MNKFFYTTLSVIVLTLLHSSHLMAQQTPVASNITLSREGDRMVVEMDLPLGDHQAKLSEAIVFTPQIINATDTLNLTSVGIYGKNRYYYYLRNGESLQEEGRSVRFRNSKAPKIYHYRDEVPYAKWMEGAQIFILKQGFSCSNCLAKEERIPGGVSYETPKREYKPTFLFVAPKVEEKYRSVTAQAYVDFPISRSDIRPNYRNNKAEIAKILNVMDSVRNDSDTTIKKVLLKGYASPEGPYANNRRLAKERTDALRNYVAKQENSLAKLMDVDFEAENWEGLRLYVEESNLDTKGAILEIIDSNLEPDAKERKIRTSYPKEFAQMKEEILPALRRTDCIISFSVRQYNSLDEIRAAAKTKPQNLSPNEFYRLAQSIQSDKEQSMQLYRTAAKYYPNDPVANLNAATASLALGDYYAAAQFLTNAGDSPEAIFARGQLAALRGDFESAARLFNQIRNILPEAVQALNQLK